MPGVRPVNRALTSISGEEFVVEAGGVYAVCNLAFSTDLNSLNAPTVILRTPESLLSAFKKLDVQAFFYL